MTCVRAGSPVPAPSGHVFGCLCVQLGVGWAGEQVPPQPFTFMASEWGCQISRKTLMKEWGVSGCRNSGEHAEPGVTTLELQVFVFGVLQRPERSTGLEAVLHCCGFILGCTALLLLWQEWLCPWGLRWAAFRGSHGEGGSSLLCAWKAGLGDLHI